MWYVRLRRASRHGVYHTSLLEAERLSGPCKKVMHPVQCVREANAALYTPLMGGDDEPSSESSLEGNAEEDFLESLGDEDEDIYEVYRKEKTKLRSAAAKREFFSGIKFQMRTDSI